MADLLPELRSYLITQNLVRDPRSSTPTDKPPFWLEPRFGVPAPGELPPDSQEPVQVGADAVLGAWITNGVPPAPLNAGRRLDIVDVRYRTRTAPIAHTLEEQLRAALLDKRNWVMGALTIIETLIYRELQPLGSDKQSYDWVQSFTFERYSGLP